MKTLIGPGLVVAGLLTVGGAPASAQIDQPMKFTTTFAFMVGSKMLPAGNYTVGPAGTDPTVLEVRGKGGSAMFTTENASVPRTDPKQSEVIFDKSGDHSVLTEVWDESTRQGAERVPSRTERHEVATLVHDKQ
jgi:hypothetical protein